SSGGLSVTEFPASSTDTTFAITTMSAFLNSFSYGQSSTWRPLSEVQQMQADAMVAASRAEVRPHIGSPFKRHSGLEETRAHRAPSPFFLCRAQVPVGEGERGTDTASLRKYGGRRRSACRFRHGRFSFK